MISEPALLIVAPMMNGFDLAHLPWSREAGGRLVVNGAKFDDLDMLEVIVDGMQFLPACPPKKAGGNLPMKISGRFPATFPIRTVQPLA